jgi:prepilin-type N-terminal cleavage/methylation domain-containing protein
VESRSDAGFTLVEILIVLTVIGVLAAAAIPQMLRARMSANEASAIQSLRTVSAAQVTYASTCGRGGFAQTLDDLARTSGSTTAFLSLDLGYNGIVKSGYSITMQGDAGATTVLPAASTCNGSAMDSVSGYFAEAHPVSVGSSGLRSFAIDRRGTIYFRPDGATITPGMAGANPLQ